MKKILSVVLALAMVLSIGSIAAFAAETAKVEAVIDGTEPAAVGDVFKVNVVVKDVSTNTLSGVATVLTYNPAVVVPCTSAGVEATTAAKSIVNRSDMYNGDEETGVFAYTNRTADFVNGKLTYDLYIHQDQTELPGVEVTGITMEGAYAAPFTAFTVYFKVVGEGEAKITTSAGSIVNYAPGREADLTLGGPNVVIGEVSTVKTITSVAAPADQTITEGETPDLPATLVGTTEDGTVEVPVVWEDKTLVVGDNTITGTLTIPEGYELAEGLATTVTAKVTVEAAAPVDIEITAVEAPATVTVEVGETVTLPETVVGTTADGTVDVTVAWEAVDTTAAGTYTITGTLAAPEGYKLAEGLTTVTATVVVNEPAPVEPGKYAVNAEYTIDTNGGISNIYLTLTKNEEYAGSVELDENDITVIVMSSKGTTPIAVIPVNGKAVLGQVIQITNQDSNIDTLDISVVQGIVVGQPFTGSNIGTPVAFIPTISLAD